MATEKQKRAFENSVVNGGNITKAMREAGYSENTYNTPQKLTESVGWQELLEEHIPDDLLKKKLKEGLDAHYKDEADYKTRHKYLDTALKLRDKFPVKKEEYTHIFPKPILDGISKDNSSRQDTESQEEN